MLTAAALAGALIAVARARRAAVRVLHGFMLIMFGVTVLAGAADGVARSTSRTLGLPVAGVGLLGVTFVVRGVAVWRRNGVLADARAWLGQLISEPQPAEEREPPGS
jgi:hypothetical protein